MSACAGRGLGGFCRCCRSLRIVRVCDDLSGFVNGVFDISDGFGGISNGFRV